MLLLLSLQKMFAVRERSLSARQLTSGLVTLRRSRPLKVIEVGINRTPVCDFLFVMLIELFSLGVTAEALRANIG